MNKMRYLFILIILPLMSIQLPAQSEIVSLEFEPGEVLDVLLVNRAPNVDELYTRYRETAFPVAFNYSFEVMSVMSSKEILLGTPNINTFIFGKWDSVERRESFLADIVGHVPDFHEQRGDVFSYFALTYYEIQEPLSFSVDRSKHIVATSFWNEDDDSRGEFEEQWNNEIVAHGGKVVLRLENGISPTGYYYNPDAFYIIEWENKLQYLEFASKFPMPAYEVLDNVHQFSIN